MLWVVQLSMAWLSPYYKHYSFVFILQSFLHKALMPLHKPKCVGLYHQQLAYCVTQVNSLLICESDVGHTLVDTRDVPLVPSVQALFL